MPLTDTDTRLAGPALAERYRLVRSFSEQLCRPLQVEDYIVQSMPDVSPTRWHMAHVTWFFETFVLKPYQPGYEAAHPEFEYLFNSYYNRVGEQFPRARRGLLTRPSVAQIYAYRRHVDEQMKRMLDDVDRLSPQARERIELGTHHEQQHQELILMDIKHVLSCNPLVPAYRSEPLSASSASAPRLAWSEYGEEVCEIGHHGPEFAFDNEGPRHRALLPAFRLASRSVTNAEYLEFVADGGYRRSELWLADGWTTVQNEGWEAPLYWVQRDGDRHDFTLRGLQALDPHAPVCHVSFYEADAYANWAGARLPTEFEWERAADGLVVAGNFVDDERLLPVPATGSGAPSQMFGNLWEWTRSAYGPYPGFRSAKDAVGEYNGKFMCNQFVLRGGSCVTSRSHVRATYRNFFYPQQRWMFSGIRLAGDC